MRPFTPAADAADDGDDAGYEAALEASERAVLLEVVDLVLALLLGGDGGPAAPVGGGATDGADPSDAVAAPRGAGSEPLPDVWASLRWPSEQVAAPTDPALRRLLPDASTDPELALELRRLTEGDVRATKVGHLRRLRSALDAARPVLVVVPSEAPAVAAALTDVRLVLAERLGLRTDDDAEAVYALAVATSRPRDEREASRRFAAAVYSVLTELQESLVQLMVASLPPGREARPG